MKQTCYSIFGVPLLLALVSLPAPALTLDELHAVEPNLTNEQAQALLGTGSLTRYFDGHEPPALVPACSRSPSVKADISSLDYTTGVETLYFAKEGVQDDAAAMLGWYNVLRSISTLKGVKYYDLLSGKMQTLFSQSYAVDDPTDRKRIADTFVTTLPPESTITIMQDDSRFGSNYYSVRYLAAPDAVSMSMTNLTTLSVLFISVVSPGDMQMHLVVMPWKGSRLFYGSVVVKAGAMFGLKGMVRDAFHNRIVALYSWFSELALSVGQ